MEAPLTVNEKTNMGFFRRFGGLFTSPSQVFSCLRENPDFFWPVIFILIITGFTYPVSQFSTQLMADTYPKYAEILKTQSKNASLISAVAGSLITLILSWVVRSGVFSLSARILGGERTRFISVLSAIGYTYLPVTLRTVFQGMVLLVTGTYPPVGLEMGMEMGDRFFSPTGVALAEINPFTLLYVIFTVIALEKLFKLSRGKSILITVLSWMVVLGLSVFFATFSQQFYQ